MAWQTLAYWCGSACLFALGALALMIALLRHGGSNRFKNRRLAELMWQSRNRNTDWWLEINKKK